MIQIKGTDKNSKNDDFNINNEKKFMNELQNQYLNCAICHERYTEPKVLNCLHTFCLECLESHHENMTHKRHFRVIANRQITCPICRKSTTLPTGGLRRLPDNHTIRRLNDMVFVQSIANAAAETATYGVNDSKILCDVCKFLERNSENQHSSSSSKSKHVFTVAVSRCLECEKNFCYKCNKQHKQQKVTAHHNVIELEQIEKVLCSKHTAEVVRFYCETCQQSVCLLCAMDGTLHSQHELVELKEWSVRCRKEMEHSNELCQNQLRVLANTLEIMQYWELDEKRLRTAINAAADDFISQIGIQQEKLLQQVQNFAPFNANLLLQKQRNEMSAVFIDLSRLATLTDFFQGGHITEILQVKKQINMELKPLLQYDILKLPDVLLNKSSKRMIFQGGSLYFGELVEEKEKNIIDSNDYWETESNSSYFTYYSESDWGHSNRNTNSLNMCPSTKSLCFSKSKATIFEDEPSEKQCLDSAVQTECTNKTKTHSTKFSRSVSNQCNLLQEFNKDSSTSMISSLAVVDSKCLPNGAQKTSTSTQIEHPKFLDSVIQTEAVQLVNVGCQAGNLKITSKTAHKWQLFTDAITQTVAQKKRSSLSVENPTLANQQDYLTEVMDLKKKLKDLTQRLLICSESEKKTKERNENCTKENTIYQSTNRKDSNAAVDEGSHAAVSLRCNNLSRSLDSLAKKEEDSKRKMSPYGFGNAARFWQQMDRNISQQQQQSLCGLKSSKLC